MVLRAVVLVLAGASSAMVATAFVPGGRPMVVRPTHVRALATRPPTVMMANGRKR